MLHSKDCIFPSKDDSDDELDALYVKNSCSDSVSLRLQVSRDGGGSGEYPIKMASEDGCNIEGGESESKVSDGKCAKGEGTKLLTDAEVEDWFVSLDALVNKDHSYSFQFCFLDEDKDAD